MVDSGYPRGLCCSIVRCVVVPLSSFVDLSAVFDPCRLISTSAFRVSLEVIIACTFFSLSGNENLERCGSTACADV